MFLSPLNLDGRLLDFQALTKEKSLYIESVLLLMTSLTKFLEEAEGQTEIPTQDLKNRERILSVQEANSNSLTTPLRKVAK